MPFKDKIAIIGVGCTKFGEHFDKSYYDLVVEAASEAFTNAGIGSDEIDAAWLGTAFPDAGVYKGRAGMDLAEPLGLFNIPITRVSNYCATGGDALRNASCALLAGSCRFALALGVEKLRDRSPQESLVKMMVETGHPFQQKGFTAPGTFACFAARHMHEYGSKKEHLADIAVKNHKHALTNDKAHYRAEVTREQVLKSLPVSPPLSLLDCCPTTDGAAALILCRVEDAQALHKDFVVLKGQSLMVATGWDLPFYDTAYHFTGFESTQRAAAEAYRQAGVKEPLEEIDVAEVHDCFSIVELLAYEDLGFCEKGQGAHFLEEGHPYAGGKLPVNLSGGLLSCGHPVGATGLRMIYELTRQLLGQAGARQLPQVDLVLAHNIGGPGAVTSVTLLGRL